jgi:hypothetical protein
MLNNELVRVFSVGLHQRHVIAEELDDIPLTRTSLAGKCRLIPLDQRHQPPPLFPQHLDTAFQNLFGGGFASEECASESSEENQVLHEVRPVERCNESHSA